jgi:hypothetical protein
MNRRHVLAQLLGEVDRADAPRNVPCERDVVRHEIVGILRLLGPLGRRASRASRA